MKKIIRQGKDINKLFFVVEKLSKNEQLDIKYRDYALINSKKIKNCRDCHIEQDWILIYKYLEDKLVLLLVNTGSHSETLDK